MSSAPSGRPRHDREVPAGPTPRQLPGNVQGFVNRHQDLAQLERRLSPDEAPTERTIVLIAGTAGVGKTALALQWAHQVRTRFPDGQLYANLHGYDPGPPRPPGAVLGGFLQALGVAPSGIPADLDARSALYRSLVAERRVLVVLDNAAAAADVRPLLPGSATCLVLVTSRSRLSPLVTQEGAYRLTLDVLTEQDAAALVLVGTERYRSGDSLQEIDDLAALCAHLPLALRIAAERAASLPHIGLADLVQDLRDESALWDLLTSPDDQQSSSARSVFAWSYRALHQHGARMFRLLGLHPGADFPAGSAAALAGTSLVEARQLLDHLVGVHLLTQPARDRYSFHELLRAYAADQAHREEPEAERRAAIARVIRWYLHSAAAAVAATTYDAYDLDLVPLDPGVAPAVLVDHTAAVRWYDAERANLTTIVTTALDLGLVDEAWQLSGVLHGFHNFRHAFDDWFATARVGITAARRAGHRRGEALLLFSLGKAYLQTQQPGAALERFETSLDIHQETGDRRAECVTLSGAALANLQLRRLDDALASAGRSLALAVDMGDRRRAAFARLLLGWVRLERGDLDGALDDVGASVRDFETLGHRASEIDARVKLGEVQRESGRLAEAAETIEATLATADELDDRVIAGVALIELGRLQLAAAEAEDALLSFQQAATVQRRAGNRGREAVALDGTGLAYQQLGRHEEAVDFHRTAGTVLRELGERWPLIATLDHLATALVRIGAEDEAIAHWEEALGILEAFGDPRAEQRKELIRASVGRLVGDDPTSSW